MGKSAEETKGAAEVKHPADTKETKGSCGCGCIPSGKDK